MPLSSSLVDGLSKGLKRMVWLCRTVDSEEFERWWEEKGIKTHMAQQLFKEYASPSPFDPCGKPRLRLREASCWQDRYQR